MRITEPSVHNEALYAVWNKSNYTNEDLFVKPDYEKLFKKDWLSGLLFDIDT